MLSGGSVWVGNRYYKRQDVHITDFFYWDTSGTGIGIEDYKAGPVNLSYAIFRSTFGQDTAATRHDFRVGGIPVPLGDLTVGLQYNTADTSVPANDNKGQGITVQHFAPNILGGFNKLALQYAKGTVANFGFGNPATADPASAQDAKRQRLVEMLQVQLSPQFSGMATFVWEKMEAPNSTWIGFNHDRWISFGVRPVWHLGDYFKVQFEYGHDEIEPNSFSAIQQTLKLDKLTIAPTIVAGRGFWARPELRVFYTYAKWNDAARDNGGGVAGGTGGPFGTDTNGSTIGFQVEGWW
jgi:maltoporin